MKIFSKQKETRKKDRNDFSDFFINASSREKKKLLKRVVRKTNDEQRKLVERYDKLERQGSL